MELPERARRALAERDQAARNRGGAVSHYAPGGVCDRAPSPACSGTVKRYMNARLCEAHGYPQPPVDPELTQVAGVRRYRAHARAVMNRAPITQAIGRKADPWHDPGCTQSARKHAGPCTT